MIVLRVQCTAREHVEPTLGNMKGIWFCLCIKGSATAGEHSLCTETAVQCLPPRLGRGVPGVFQTA